MSIHKGSIAELSENTAASPIPSHYPSAQVGWTTVMILFVFYVFSLIDRQIITMLVGPIQRELHIDDVKASLLLGFAFALFYATGGLGMGWIADRWSRRNLIAICVVLWGLAAAACGLARNFTQLFILRMLVGVGEAALGPATYSLLSDSFPKRRLTFALAVYVTGGIAGAALATLLGGFVIEFGASHGSIALPAIGTISSWRFVFLLTGVPGLFLAPLAFIVPEPRRIGSTRKLEGEAAPRLLSFLIRQRQLLCWHCLGFSGLATIVASTSWMPVVMERSYQFKPTHIGASISVLLLGAAVPGQLFSGWWIDRMVRRDRPSMYMGYFVRVLPLCAACGVLALLSTNPLWFLLGMAPLYFVAFSYVSAATAALQVVTPNEFRARTSALFLMISTLIGLGGGPTLVAAISTAMDPAGNSIAKAVAIVFAGAATVAVSSLRVAERHFPRS